MGTKGQASMKVPATSGAATLAPARRRGRKPITDPLHLTPSERALLVFIEAEGTDRDGLSATKRGLSESLGKSVKTVDHAASRLRRMGMLESVASYGESGGQGPSSYRVTLLAHRTYPELFASE